MKYFTAIVHKKNIPSINIFKKLNDCKKFWYTKYHLMLSNSDLLIGNSSSGIIESYSFKILCINLGDS